MKDIEYDYALGNYKVQKMTITDSSYDSTTKRQSVTVIGNVNGEKVYFSRFDEDLNKLYELYPFISSNTKNAYVIKVLKFKHSHKVMLLADNEFIQWKNHLLISGLYILFSMMYFCSNNLKMERSKPKNENSEIYM